MAGLIGLKVVLLWAGLLGLGRCQSAPTAGNNPPSTTPTSPAITSISQASGQTASPNVTEQADPPRTTDPQSNHSTPTVVAPSQALPANTSTAQNGSLTTPPTPTPTSPASTPPSTKPPTPGNQTDQKCSFSVENSQDGLQINIPSLTASTADEYTIHLTEMSEHGQNVTHQLKCANVPSCRIDMLLPCTNYSVRVEFGNDTCEQTGEQLVRTRDLVESDIKHNTVCIPGYLCYESNWNISGMIQPPLKHVASIKTCDNADRQCIELLDGDFCSELETNLDCSSPNIIRTPITLDQFERSLVDVKINGAEKLPVKPNWINKPKNCNESIELDYSCQVSTGKGVSEVNISMLEPYTKYDCTGRVILNNQTINKTTVFPVNVDCSLNITLSSTHSNTSISLSWTTTSDKCHEEHLLKLSYQSCCSEGKSCRSPEEYRTVTNGSSVNITGLKPYRDYSCYVNPHYNGIRVEGQGKVDVKTKPGVPKKVELRSTVLKENNYFFIECGQLPEEDWNGPSITYVASLNDVTSLKNKICQFDFKDLSYSTTYTLTVYAYNGHFNSALTVRQIDTRYNDKAVIGILVFLIILTSLALTFVAYKIYLLHRRKFSGSHETHELFVESREDTMMSVEPISAELLLDTYKRKMADEGRLFLDEFQSIPRVFSTYAVKEARKQCNQAKNRYVDILPYDHNRVQLSSGSGETGADYINASFIDGFKEPKKYIAAQGPKEETVADFWRMIWEQQSSVIVMVTRCEESNKIKCAQYWPGAEQEAEIFDEFVVKLNTEDLCPDYIIRRLSLTNKRDKSSEREVTHIQFTSWPDHGVPGEPHLLLKLRRRVNTFKNLFSGPIVIHCSAGVGRTGTYISIDAMMEALDSEGRVDIYGYVVGLRRQRSLMVQVEAQYILIHQALIEHNQFGETEIPVAEFHSTLAKIQTRDPGNEPSLLEAEFQRLPRFKNWRTFNIGTTEENRKKNRYSSVVPYDYNRVLVKADENSPPTSVTESDEEDSTDEEEEHSCIYINASHIDSYWCPGGLIATQGPLPHTSADFWQMVHGKRAHAIVMLSDCREGDQEFCSAYWGNSKMTFGEVEVEVIATEESAGYSVRTIQLRHAKRKEGWQVKQYHFLKWAGRDLPERSQELTDMIRNIKQACGLGSSQSERSGAVVVHCSDGSSRSGVFCALWNLLDCAKTEKMVDVFQVAKALRKERQGMIPSLAQYQFLYEALDRAFPVQNGEVKQAAAPSTAFVQIVNETQPAPAGSATASSQQGAAETVPLMADSGKDMGAAETPKGGSEEPRLGDASNGPLVTVDL